MVTPPLTTSEAIFGPFPGNAAYTGGIVYMQAVVVSAPPTFTTMCTIFL